MNTIKSKNACILKLLACFTLIMAVMGPALADQDIRGVKIVASDNEKAQLVEIPLYSKTYAIVIGIDRYPNLPPDQQLTYAVSDAQAVERILRGKFLFNEILTLYNETATRNNIMDILINKLSTVSKDDAVLVFYAGHGGQENTDFGQIGYIVPFDGKFNDMTSVISMTSIRDDISKRIKAKHVFYVMDSCYSGILVATRGSEGNKTRRDLAYLQQIAKEPVRQVLTAGDANQQVLDGGPDGHSVFTGRFLQILNEADDFITASEISTLVKERVFSDARARNHVQTPKDGEFFGLGDFIFMPSNTKKLGSLQDQITNISRELDELKQAEEKASAVKDEAARREAERKRRVAEASLEAKRLEADRIKKEEDENSRRAQARQEQQDEAKKRQEEESLRLALLQKEVEQKRLSRKIVMAASVADAVRELRAVETEIFGIREKYRNELKSRVMGIARSYSENLKDASLQKDEFETEEEYKARLSNTAGGQFGDNKPLYRAAIEQVEAEYERQVKPLRQQMEEISNIIYTVYGNETVDVVLGSYDAERQCFPVTIASKNIGRTIYPQPRYQLVSNTGWGGDRKGYAKGDVIVRYNGREVASNSNWNFLKQTVLSETTQIEIDRGGKLLSLSIPKGDLGIETNVDDYLYDIPAGQFVASGYLSIPREEARRFKQNYANGFITAEMKVSAASPDLCLVTGAVVVDETGDKRYDLFRSTYVHLGNRLVYDVHNNIYWLANTFGPLTYKGTTSFLRRMAHRKTGNWGLPAIEALRSIRQADSSWQSAIDEYMLYSNSLTDNQANHVQYRPKDNSTDYGDGESERFVAVSQKPMLMQYEIFEDRYIFIDENLVFDVKSTLVWLVARPAKKFTYIEGETYLRGLSYSQLKGFRMPELEEFKSLWDPSIPGVDTRLRESLKGVFYTRTVSSTPQHHWQYSPNENSTDYGDGESEWVIGVL